MVPMSSGLMRQLFSTQSLALVLLLLSAQPVSAHSDKKKLSFAPGITVPRADLPAKKIPPEYLYKSIKKAIHHSYPESHLEKGLLFKQQGNLKQALAEFDLALQENPQQAKVFYEQALVLLTNGSVKLAVSSLHRALAVSPNFPEARKLLSRLEQELGMQEAPESAKTMVAEVHVDPIAKRAEGKDDLPPAVAQALGLSNQAGTALDTPVSSVNAASLNEHALQAPGQKRSLARLRSLFRSGALHKPVAEVVPESAGPAVEKTSSWSKAFRIFSRNKNGGVAESVSAEPEPETEDLPRLETAYGILTENAAKNIDKFNIPSRVGAENEPPVRPSFLESVWKQAAQALANLIPDFSKISLSSLLHPDETPPSAQEIISSAAPIDAASGEPAPAEVQQAASQPTPMPVDVMNILKKIEPKAPASPEPSLVAANRVLNLPTPSAIAVDHSHKPWPRMRERGAVPAPLIIPSNMVPGNNPTNACPPAPAALPNLIPPAVREILSRAEPLIPAAMQAFHDITDSLSNAPLPLEIPRSGNEAPVPVQPSTLAIANDVPAPTAASMDKYFGEPMIPTVPETAQTAATVLTGRTHSQAAPAQPVRGISTKSGAFSYIQPLMDNNKHPYLEKSKLPRTICQAPATPVALAPAKAQAPAVPEDAITKRMRYLLEHGTQNIKPGEAFMYSEETGEGVLFLPNGQSERRRLSAAQDPERIMRARRPDIMEPKDLQYSLSLLGKLLSSGEQTQQQNQQPVQPIGGPTLEQLMNQSSQGIRGWLKNTFKF